ncbi:exopolysaccharide biosynthesis protein [Ciceribacter ferrooxidans]|uniref:Exopolysaccharide biosynthesis protein n=1 Tax=Ciceribacter ferrooxidans TaxID=2509717 RepID=A0A4Q2S771_9HYPH|nr:exopolysaccharide biosynthesis protein [Ciceribacter ferrooxidans]RYB97938.1 exopolysaccharide biosynthesis protein [Ciceribacter ferrooxidans]
MTGDAEADRETYESGRSRRHGGRLSEILSGLAADEGRPRISVADIFQAMGDRAFGALILIFAVPNIVPTPPGTSALTGTPLVFLAAQLMLGQKPWLPRIIADRSMTRQDFAAIITRVTPWLAKAERMLRPRLGFLVYPPAEYLIGFVCLLLAVILALPVPLGNILPAIAICFFSFGILERDGICVLIGAVIAAIAGVVVAGVVYALVKGFLLLLQATLF